MASVSALTMDVEELDITLIPQANPANHALQDAKIVSFQQINDLNVGTSLTLTYLIGQHINA